MHTLCSSLSIFLPFLKPSTLLPQDLCSCCALFLGCSSPSSLTSCGLSTIFSKTAALLPPCCVLPQPIPATAVICAPYNGGSGEQGHMSVSHRAPPENRMAVTSRGAPGGLLLRLSCVKMLQQPQPSPLPPRRSWLFSGRVLPEEKGEAPATTGQTPILGMSIGSNWPSLVHRPTPETTALARGMWGSD